MNELHLFAGAGGGILAGQMLGHRCVCAVELDEYARHVLIARQNDGTFQPFPIWDDIRTFNGSHWRGIADVVVGGFPCQDISRIGDGGGLDGENSGLWTEMARVIGEVRPSFVHIENSPMLVSRGLDTVLSDLAKLGFDAEWGCLPASAVGAPHQRNRVWVVAYTPRHGLERRHIIDSQRQRYAATGSVSGLDQECSWPDVSKPRAFGSCDGVAHRTYRLKAIGNGQVPHQAAAAFRLLGGTNIE